MAMTAGWNCSSSSRIPWPISRTRSARVSFCVERITNLVAHPPVLRRPRFGPQFENEIHQLGGQLVVAAGVSSLQWSNEGTQEARELFEQRDGTRQGADQRRIRLAGRFEFLILNE